MKQLFIVDSNAALNGGKASPKDLNGMTAGSIGFFYPDSPSAWLSAAATKDFAIAYGRGSKSPAIIIPEVNFATLSVVETQPVDGSQFDVTVTLGSVEVTGGENYTLVLSKLGVHFNERSNYTVTEFVPINSSKTIKDVALSLAKQLKAKAEFENLNIDVTIDGEDPSSAAVADLTDCAIQIDGMDATSYKLQGGDALSTVEISVNAEGQEAIGDKAYVEKLASMCAQNRGFSDTYADGPTTIPGYPMPVEDTTYVIFTLRFAVPRKSAKTRDEVVSQLVHIAVPESSVAVGSIETILGI